MNPLGDMLGKAASGAAEATGSKARMMVLRVLDFCRVASLDELPAHVRPTLIALGKCADAQGVCWPTYRVLAEYTGRTRRTVIRHVAQLAAFVRKQQRYRVNARCPEHPRNRSNKFFLDVPERRPAARRFKTTIQERSLRNIGAPTSISAFPQRPNFVPRPATTCGERPAARDEERAAVSRAPACVGSVQEPVTVMSAEETAVLSALRSEAMLASFANDDDAARLWFIAKAAVCTVADVERAIVELVKKTPTRVKLSRVGAWGRLVSFVEGTGKLRKETPAISSRARAEEELRRDAEDRRRDQEAARGTVPIPTDVVAQLRERGLLRARPP